MMSGSHEHGRGYVPGYTVRYRGSQSANDRFGPGHDFDIKFMLDSEDDEDDPPDVNDQWAGFPHVARTRMNLTALSQHYNLYFVAYRGYIYVYRLNRGVKTALAEPEAILDPKNHETPASKLVQGHLNANCPDCINHMIVGEFGNEEILLVGRDNGDVAAWYTCSIAHCIEINMSRSEDTSRPSEKHPSGASPLPDPKHFFAENVGLSAWGLAIHKKSRLIAVSSNTHEITVFALAMGHEGDAAKQASSPGHENDYDEAIPTEQKETSDTTPSTINRLDGDVPNFTEQMGWAGYDTPSTADSKAKSRAAQLQRDLRTRQRSWRIVLSLGKDASNIPSISFCEDAEGNAIRVAGIDINGYLYVADIWHIGRKPIRIPPHNVQAPGGLPRTYVMGWNILAILDAQLLSTDSVHAATGLNPRRAVHRTKATRGTWLDISACMSEVAHDAASEIHRQRLSDFRLEDFSQESDGLMPDSFLEAGDHAHATPHATSHLSSQLLGPPVLDPLDGADLGGGAIRIAMTVVPHSGECHTVFPTPKALVDFAGRKGARSRMYKVNAALTLGEFREKARDWEAEDLLKDVSFLRFNEQDFEVVSFGESDCGVVCNHVLENWNQYNIREYWDMRFDRCNMLLRIPELHLVVIGCMSGRVALITLTKPPQPDEEPTPPSRPRVPRCAFRVDAVLPFDAEEIILKRPYLCLLGIAVSPVPEARARALELRARRMTTEPARRWRLVLNYMDHTVLQYDIVKREEREEGSWEDFAGSSMMGIGEISVVDGDEEKGGEDEQEEDDYELEPAADGPDDAGTGLTGADQEETVVAMSPGVGPYPNSDEDDVPDVQIA